MSPRHSGSTRKTTERPGTRRGVLYRSTSSTIQLLNQLQRIERARGDGALEFDGGTTLNVSNLNKVYFPEIGLTKGALMRYYVRVSGALLPLIEDRPLVLKRYPDGVGGASWYQQSPGTSVPAGVRVERVAVEGGGRAPRLIGGDLPTLLYAVQLGAIAVHAWQSRLESIHDADFSTIDLDPGGEVPFRDVVRLARLVHQELDGMGLRAAVKTSGSSGLHIVLPLPSGTSYRESARVAQLVSDRLVERYPDLATTQRRIRARPRGSIYLDWQQNAAGKSVVVAYSARERSNATVSAPLDWRELRSDLRLDAFTVDSMPGRLRRKGDIWAESMKRRNTGRAIEMALQNV